MKRKCSPAGSPKAASWKRPFRRWDRAITPSSCKKVADSGESLPSEILVHDGTAFTPLSQKPTVDHADQAGLPGAQEAEKLPILESAPGATFVLPWGREKGFLLWGKANPGDRLKLQFDSRESGERTLILALGRAKNGGIVRIAV